MRRFDLEGEEKAKLDRVRKFYTAVADTVELRRYAPRTPPPRSPGWRKRAGVAIESDAMELLIESLAADVARIAVEIEKLSLYAGPGRKVTTEDIGALVPDARARPSSRWSAALGRRDRARRIWPSWIRW